jgi:hypothetical protein
VLTLACTQFHVLEQHGREHGERSDMKREERKSLLHPIKIIMQCGMAFDLIRIYTDRWMVDCDVMMAEI